MRDIRFRAWNKSAQEWYPENEMNTIGGFYYSGGMENEQYILCQYTGLKSKSGIEIYEGDILQIYTYKERSSKGDFKWKKEKVNVEVKFLENLGCFNITLLLIQGKQIAKHYKGYCLEKYDVDNATEYEVIGNVCKNKELLNE